MTGPTTYVPDEARADAAQRGYHTPGSLRVLLGLRWWEFDDVARDDERGELRGDPPGATGCTTEI